MFVKMNSKIDRVKAIAARKNRKGFGLIELTLALAIAAVVGIVVFRAYSGASESNRIQEQTQQVGQVRAAIENLYASQTNFADLKNSAIVKNLPASMVDEAADTITNPFNGTVVVEPGLVNTADDAFTITLSNLSDTACQRLAATDLGRNVKRVNIGAVAVIGSNDGAYSPAEATTKCTGGSAGNTVSWLFQ